MLPKEVDTVIIAANYKKQQLEDYFDTLNYTKTIIVNDEPKPLGTAGAVKFADRYLTDQFFVLNSDIICSINLTDMIAFHNKQNAVATISLWPVENVSEFGVVEIKSNGNITRFVEKPNQDEAPSNLINAGAYFLESTILDYIETGKLISMEKEIFPQIISNTNKFFGFEFQGYWMDIGRIQSYLNIHQFLLQKRNSNNFYGKDVINHGMVEKSVIGNNVNLGKNSKIDKSVILDNVIIKEESTIYQSVIGSNSLIKSNCHLSSVVVGDNETIESGTKYENKTIWSQNVPEEYPNKQIGNVIGE
jgi:mannose-1-phosphate guanylyltransferase